MRFLDMNQILYYFCCEKKNKMPLKTIPPLTLLLLLALTACHKQTFDEKVLENIASINRRLPIRLDTLSVMDSLVFLPSTQTLQTHNTLEGFLDNDSLLTEEVRQTLSDNLLNSLKNNIQFRTYKEKGFQFQYLYHSRSSGKLLMQFTFSPADYR